MFRFKSGTFQFVLLFIYIQNKQKTHERKRTAYVFITIEQPKLIRNIRV